MKKIFTPLLFLIVGITSWAEIPEGYYNNAIGKQDEALMTSLEGIVYSHTELTYAYLWTAFDVTDVGDDGYYIDMYSNCKYNNQADHTSGASYVGQGINREHSFPKSWYDSQEPIYTDLHMLIPTDAYVNQRRSNYPYGVCSSGETFTNGEWTMKGKLGTSSYNGYTSTVFEPDDEYKGDFARIYFYIVTCYKSSVKQWSGSGQLDYSTNGYKAFSDWSLQMLMEWHRADPVSQKEINRNDSVYSEQNNRNPFVDHPELAEYIWGTKQNTAWTGSDDGDDPLVKVVPEMYAVDTSSIGAGTFRADWTGVDNVSSYTLYVNRTGDVPSEGDHLLSETFSKINVYSEGYTDIGSYMDSLADNVGWTGYKVYEAVGNGVKLGTSSTAGYIITPELDLTSTVTVKLNAASWVGSAGSDNSTVVVSCGGVSQTVALTDDATDYTVVLTDCADRNIKISCTGSKKRLYVYSVDVYNGDITALLNAPQRVIVEEGDSTTRTVSGITDTCYTVKELTSGIYEYMVKAIYTDGDESVWSNIQYVTLTESGVVDDVLIGDVNCDGRIDIGDVTTLIDYLLGDPVTPFDEAAADVNQDGSIDIGDVTSLIDLLLGVEE